MCVVLFQCCALVVVVVVVAIVGEIGLCEVYVL